MNSFKLTDLEKYNSISWDIDDTLLDNPYGKLYMKYIKAHSDQKHYLLTYRTHHMFSDIPVDFRNAYGINVDTFFDDIYSIPDQMYIDYAKATRFPQDMMTNEQKNSVIAYNSFKPKVCHEHGIPVLVDDQYINILPYCADYGVTLFNSYGLVVDV